MSTATGVRWLAVACLVVFLVGCGSSGGAPGSGPDDTDTSIGQTTEPTETEEAEEAEEESEASVTTTLDLGAPFAEDPSTEAALDNFAVDITSMRRDLSAIPVTIRITNETGQAREVLDLDVQVDWLPSTADPLAADPANTLIASIEANTGTCTTGASTAATFTGSCTVGRLDPQQQAEISLIVTSTYNLEIGLHLRANTE